MYVLIVYDIGEKRVNRVLKVCRRYLDWVQNSVLEGEITKTNLETLKSQLKRIIKVEEDSVRIYKLRTENDVNLEILGIDKKQVFDDGII
ncbi:CRISPR-associated endonuclease Cas2 [Kosmotoga olearia]|uniref:CRISPR-associated endoribonuclease Cas2 n=1 Tax=Kosmotoga olearia (strain ATCC BAA-1733 / DSM 21960 / TBF 19.5.1) TaxID=521045 RepID=C5CFA0_KOSOT|nr:CRISPR-associated endonuclease Cas2 [Kosmotoga olearia]ACR79377.1 CRISPR-associated protein Cas2 [Kosmotoga olearia TBF 19.5.1]